MPVLHGPVRQSSLRAILHDWVMTSSPADTCPQTAGCILKDPSRTPKTNLLVGKAATDLQDNDQNGTKPTQQAVDKPPHEDINAQVVVSISPVAGVAAPSTAASATPASSTTAISFSGRVNLLDSTAVVPGGNA